MEFFKTFYNIVPKRQSYERQKIILELSMFELKVVYKNEV